MTQGPTTFVLSTATVRACPEWRLDPAHYLGFDGGCAHTASEAYAAGRAHFENVGPRDAPLSGEHAAESMPELAAEFGLDFEDDEQATDFEAGFAMAAEVAL